MAAVFRSSRCSRKVVQDKKGKCPDCGSGFIESPEQKHFWSGPFPEKGRALALSAGTMLADRFKIEKHIDNGRYGSVYLAEDTICSMQVALKVTEVGPQSEEIARVQLQREMAVYSKISNFEHVIKVYDIHFVLWEGTGLLLLSMEFANGGNFRKWLMDHRKDWEARRTIGLDYFKQACQGVNVIHQAGALHLDLKPENLLVLDKKLKVSDLGAASLAQQLQESSGLNGETLPSDFGTPAYMSPERFLAGHSEDLDEAADIYSLGIILYEVLDPKGRVPFWGSDRRIEELHLRATAPPPPKVEERLSAVITRCIEKNPAHRFQSIAELLDELEEKADNSPPDIPLEASTDEAIDEIEEIWENASLLFSQGNLNEAARVNESVLNTKPDHPGARSLKEEISRRFFEAEQLYREIEENLEHEDLSDLAGLLKEAIIIYPNHPVGRLIQARLGHRARRYRKALEEGIGSLQGGHWEYALEYFRHALELQPGASYLKPIIGFLTKIDDLRGDIHEALARGASKEGIRIAHFIDLLVEQKKREIPALRGIP